MKIEKHGGDWKQIREWITKSIAAGHVALESDLSELDTAKERGAIAALRALFNEVEPNEPESVETPEGYSEY